ncbi:MAG: ParA family protein [Puniceicoccaceae bacterium]
MARKIAFINYKGGVGKTSCLVNMAACLAKRGKRVLLVDLDAQSNVSIWLLRIDRWNKLHGSKRDSVYSLFNPGDQQLKDIVVRDVVEDREGRKILPGLDLVPTTFDLIDIEHEYEPPADEPVFVRFWQTLQAIEPNYDYILFDCPPNVLRASQCGLFCANEVIVPANPDALSLIGLTLLTGKLLQFNDRSARYRTPGMGQPATINGVIFNAVKGGTDVEVPKMRMQFRINQFKNQKKISPKTRIFGTMVRDAIVVRRAVTLGLPVNCIGNAIGTEDVMEDYEGVTNELEALDPNNIATVDNLQMAETV